MSEKDESGAVSDEVREVEESDVGDVEVVDELMDHVAALLQSQMRTANQHLRRRAARLLSPTGGSMSASPSPGGDGAAAGE